MTNHDLENAHQQSANNQHVANKKSRGASKPHGTSHASPAAASDMPTSESLAISVEQTLQLGDQFIGFATGVIDLARTEILLAVRTLPNLMMLWLLMMPIMLLTWGAFSVLIAWAAYEASQHIGLGLLVFFLQQVLLLLVCRWLYLRYSMRMTLPYTRAHIDNFVRGMQYEPDNQYESDNSSEMEK